MKHCIIGACVLALGVALAGEEVAVSKAKNINKTGCSCKVETCCVCCGEIRVDALELTLSGKESTDIFEVYLKPIDGKGPEFDTKDGGRKTCKDKNEKVLRCTTEGTKYKFDIYGGPKIDTYDVIVRICNTQVETTVCGKICVIGFKLTNVNKADLTFHPKEEVAGAQATADGVPASAKYRGAACGGTQTGKKTVHDAQSDFYGWAGTPGNEVEGGAFDGAGDRLIGKEEFPCSAIELWCVNGAFHYMFKDDCDDDWIKIGQCIWGGGENVFKVTYVKCDERNEPVFTELFNINPIALEDGTFIMSYWKWDRCGRLRDSYIIQGLTHKKPWNADENEAGKWKKGGQRKDWNPGRTGGVTPTTTDSTESGKQHKKGECE